MRSAQYLSGLSIAVYPLREMYSLVASLAGLSVRTNISMSNRLCFIFILVGWHLNACMEAGLAKCLQVGRAVVILGLPASVNSVDALGYA